MVAYNCNEILYILLQKPNFNCTKTIAYDLLSLIFLKDSF